MAVCCADCRCCYYSIMNVPLLQKHSPYTMIEFQFFNGCPNADVTLENLRVVMREFEIPESSLKFQWFQTSTQPNDWGSRAHRPFW